MVDYCTKCGSQLEEDSLFCEVCGTRVSAMSLPMERIKSIEPQKAVTPTTRESFSVSPAPLPPQTVFVSESRKRTAIWIGIGIIIILVVSSSIAGFLWWWGVWDHHYLGEKDFSIQSKDILDIQFDISNSAGDISVEFVSSNNLVDATIEIYGDRDDDLDDAATFTSTIVNGQYQAIEFDSSDDRGDFSYNLLISIAREARTKIAIDVSSGDVSLDVKTATTLTGLDLEANSGEISVDLGTDTILNCSIIDISVSSGSIDLAWTDLIVEQDIAWVVGTSSGSIDIEISQYRQPTMQKAMTFVVGTSSGDISFDYDIGSAIGLSLSGTASSGEINFPGGNNPYETSNYANAPLQLHFSLYAFSGDIESDSSA